MKKQFVLPLVALAVLGLASCGNNNPAPSGSSEAGSVPGSSVESLPSIPAEEPEEITVAELIEWNAAQDKSANYIDGDQLFKVKGILEGAKHDKYGNGFLVDGGQAIIIYGSTTTESCLAKDEATGMWAFTNPKDADTTTTAYANGEEVEMVVIRQCYYGKLEILGYFTSHTASEATYGATVTSFEHGTAALSKSEGLSYGEEYTVTVTPEEGWKVKSVKAENALTGEKVSATEADGAYKLAATTSNVVTVEMEEAGAVKDHYEITHESEGMPTGYSESKTTKDAMTHVGAAATIDGLEMNLVNVAAYSGNAYFQIASQPYNKKETDKEWRDYGAMMNTAATEKAITKIVVTADAAYTSSKKPSDIAVMTGTSALSYVEGAYDEADVYSFEENEGVFTVEVTPNAGDTYFLIGHGKGSTYVLNIKSVEVYFAA